jgi:hypothetical protein
MTLDERCSALSPLVITVMAQIADDILLLPTLSPSDTFSLAQIYTPLLSLDQLFPRNRVTDFMSAYPRYRLIPQLLELEPNKILDLWRNGRLRTAGWDAVDIIEILQRRFGRNADNVVKEIRRQYTSTPGWSN